MVKIVLPAAALTGVMQDRVASLSINTVQAPQRPAPQPNFVPTRPNSSRSAHKRGISGSTSTVIFRPLMTRNAMVVRPPIRLTEAGDYTDLKRASEADCSKRAIKSPRAANIFSVNSVRRKQAWDGDGVRPWQSPADDVSLAIR